MCLSTVWCDKGDDQVARTVPLLTLGVHAGATNCLFAQHTCSLPQNTCFLPQNKCQSLLILARGDLRSGTLFLLFYNYVRFIVAGILVQRGAVVGGMLVNVWRLLWSFGGDIAHEEDETLMRCNLRCYEQDVLLNNFGNWIWVWNDILQVGEEECPLIDIAGEIVSPIHYHNAVKILQALEDSPFGQY